MAKQSGIHQLRGKVGEHSYYRQTGISSGLVRSINQGMSSRVKNDEAYQNTRLNNAEFGQAGRIASVLARYISPKYRPMILPFSQSKMAKVILEYIKNDTSSLWGQRNITTSNSGEMQVAALNSVVKNRFEDYGLNIAVDEEISQLSIHTTQVTVDKVAAIGAVGIEVVFLATSTWIGTFVQGTGKYAESYARANRYTDDFVDVGVDDTINFAYTLRPAPPQGWPAIDAERTGVLILLPYCEVNNEKYILQEHCTFKAFVIEDGQIS